MFLIIASVLNIFALKNCVDLLKTKVLSYVGQDLEQERLISNLQDLGLRGRSALEVYHSLSPAGKGNVDKAKNKNTKPGKRGRGGKGYKLGANERGANPVKTLQGIAKKLGLGSLSAR